MKYLSSKIFNIVSTTIIAIICFFVIVNSGVLDGAGMAVIIVVWIPAIIGVFTIVAYLITNWITKKYSYIVSILGNLIYLFFAINSFWN